MLMVVMGAVLTVSAAVDQYAALMIAPCYDSDAT